MSTPIAILLAMLALLVGAYGLHATDNCDTAPEQLRDSCYVEQEGG